MGKEIYLEYTLNTRSRTAVWAFISTAVGLQKWLANTVEVHEEGFKFIWGDPLRESEVRFAKVAEAKEYSFIRLHWEDAPEDYYFEMKMIKAEIAENYHLEIREVVDESEMEDTADLWENSVRHLQRVIGL